MQLARPEPESATSGRRKEHVQEEKIVLGQLLIQRRTKTLEPRLRRDHLLLNPRKEKEKAREKVRAKAKARAKVKDWKTEVALRRDGTKPYVPELAPLLPVKRTATLANFTLLENVKGEPNVTVGILRFAHTGQMVTALKSINVHFSTERNLKDLEGLHQQRLPLQSLKPRLRLRLKPRLKQSQSPDNNCSFNLN